jgi:hypothetical protein
VAATERVRPVTHCLRPLLRHPSPCAGGTAVPA